MAALLAAIISGSPSAQISAQVAAEPSLEFKRLDANGDSYMGHAKAKVIGNFGPKELLVRKEVSVGASRPFYWRCPMTITASILSAESEYVIFFLLTAYIEATQFAGKLPQYLMNLPITGLRDVEGRFQQLIMKFDKACEQRHDIASAEINEALHIFDAALRRLRFLERQTKASSAST